MVVEAASVLLLGLATARPASAQTPCPGIVALQPVVVPGPIWARHRQQLVSDRPISWDGTYSILDTTTGESHPWVLWSDRVTVGVPTTWAYTHPGWTRDTYVLVPGCQRTAVGSADAV